MTPHNGWRTTVACFLRRLACRLDEHSRINQHGYCTACETYAEGEA